MTDRSIRLMALAVFSALAAFSATAQDPVLTLRVDVALVSVDVVVFGSDNRPITTLQQSDFTVYEDGREQSIQSFESATAPYNILLLFDRSSSTQNQWKSMRNSAGRFIRNLRPQDHVALATFDEGVTMFSHWDDTPAIATRALDEILSRGPGGASNLYWALERATQREFHDVAGRRAVVVLTDGGDNRLNQNSNQYSLSGRPRRAEDDAVFQRTKSVLGSSRIPVYFVAVNTRSSDPFVVEARTRMEMLATASGGRVFSPETTADIERIYDQISRDLGAAYTLSYISSTQDTSEQSHRIQVRARKDGVRLQQSRDTYSRP